MPRSTMTAVGLGLSVLIVAVVVVVVVGFGVHVSGQPRPVSSGGVTRSRGVRIVFRPPRSIGILRQRVGAVFPGVQVSRAGSAIVVQVPHATPADRARIVALAAPERLEFYDWELSALTPNGKTVSSQLQVHDPNALGISQGVGAAAPGDPGAGSMPLYQAVKLASEQTPSVSADHARTGREYYLFGASGSPACATAAGDEHTTPVPGAHCLLLYAPVDETTADPQRIAQDIASSLLPGVDASQGRRLVVPAGTVVLLAAPATGGQPLSFTSPTAQFYVLKDHVALFGNDITHPQRSADQSGAPDVRFGFESAGAREFQRLTAEIAHRGQTVSTPGQAMNQHLAVALDKNLIVVSSIDFKIYPDGLSAGDGADIRLTTQSARAVVATLGLGPLPVSLVAR